MKKIVLTIVSLLFCFIIFAQEVKPCLFIGIYDLEKTGVCSNKAWIKEEINDRKEYDLRKKQFLEEHKGSNATPYFVSAKEAVIVYEFQKQTSGFTCTPSYFALKKSTTIEDCEKTLATSEVTNAKEFKTQPNIVFTWQGKGVTQKETLTDDFGGVNGKFYLIDKTSGGSFVLAQLTNTKTDKRAIILLKTAEGITLEKKYLEPGGTLTEKYDTKSLEVQVLYEDSKEPKSESSLIDFVKDVVRKQITNENGMIKSVKIGSIGVRG